ncbi:GntR family transcriptional regulator [Tropicimonas sp. IMCC34043]|uniref:GntR family transcriptional regulator n=1 Tax=Tropicimonas sp. IMCC34043 TaxID=2248760 RepID=UPI00130018BE|nr:GntR family transcriptional regulator [Tropicimonas sp. IMCC34043]
MLNIPDKRLALQAYEQILELIQKGEIRPGEFVNERRLAELLEMTRTPVRDALLILEGEGLLMRHGRGLQVRQMHIEDYMDALQIRSLLEPEMARMAAGRIRTEELASIRARLESLRATELGARADRATVRSVDEDLHDMIAEAAGNPQLGQIIRNLRRQTQMFDLRAMPERLADTCDEHLRIVEALSSSDVDAARDAMRDHLDKVRDSIIQRLTRR